MTDSKFHKINTFSGEGTLPSPPERFTNPFGYEPHPLCRLVVRDLSVYIQERTEWKEELQRGKMFGVLVVEHEGQMGYIAAYSGQIAGRADHEFFVPAVFDYLQPDGYFKTHEAEISAVNRQIAAMEENPERLVLLAEIQKAQRDALMEIDAYKDVMNQAKNRRDMLRKGGLDTEQEEKLIRESQFMRAELVRLKQKWKNIQGDLDDRIAVYDAEIDNLKRQRQQMSEDLQLWLFRHFVMKNARGEQRSLVDLFRFTPQGMPPAGSGECCAPKLLQYAYNQGMKPICMAEFWWGDSPRHVVRHHLDFYPACRGKCLPILTFMLDGLEVDPDPQLKDTGADLEIMYQDPSLLVINKPAGLLSVPGRIDRRSVFTILSERGFHPKIVHRLDMDTSGLLVVPLTVEAHRFLQRQFYNRTVKKRYVAVVEPLVGIDLKEGDHGVIDLPLIADPYDRPRQMVDFQYGKRAITEWEVTVPQPNGLGEHEVCLTLTPHTGRTHQLRMHCASIEGLAAPIKGDALYGHRAERMYLHAQYIEFIHPVTGKTMRFSVAPTFIKE
ncbi:MAG: pseudouridine synthase [Prevotella sp.]